MSLACAVLLGLHTAFAAPVSPEAAIRVRTSPARGLDASDGVMRLAPSDLLRLDGRDHVLYARVPLGSEVPAGRPGPWRAEIWHAASEDGGHTWEELGPVLTPGPAGALDSVGVFDPGLLRWSDGSWLLYYAGVGPEFNPRLEREQPVTPVRIFCASLSYDPETRRVTAERRNGGRPVLSPRPRRTRAFDSLRVRDPRPLLHEGQIVLIHEGLGFGSELDSPELGVAVATSPDGPFERRLEGRAALPAGGDALIGVHEGGLFALVTGSSRGLWWAEDGEHLARLDARVNGRLSDPGLFRGDLEGILEPGQPRWGLHVGATTPTPSLERFELSVQGELQPPPATRVPVPATTDLDDWTEPGWEAQHRRTLGLSRERPVACLLLGDGLAEGFGGHDRLRSPPGAASWPEPRRGEPVANLGVTGDHSENILWRLAHGAMSGLEARVVVLAVGSDQLQEDEPGGVLEGIDAICEWVSREQPGAELVLVSIPPRPSVDGSQLAAVLEVNRGLSARVEADPRLHLLDLAAALSGTEGRTKLEAWSPRGYLASDSYRLWATLLEAQLDELDELSLLRAHRRLQELESR